MGNEKPGKDATTPDSRGTSVAADRDEPDVQREISEADAEGRSVSRADKHDDQLDAVPNDHADIDSSDDDANVIWWDGDDDPQNPFNWPVWERTLNCVLVSIMTFVTPLGSCKFSRTIILRPSVFGK